MNEYQVSCITKSTPYGGHEHITHIGGMGSSGWRLTKEAAIRRIRSKNEAFFTINKLTGGKEYIGVVDATPPYLRTHADGVWNDNLLAQPICPSAYGVLE